MDNEETFQTVTVSVPRNRVAEFYELVGRWLAGSPDAGTAAPRDESVHEPWAAPDLTEAQLVWGNLTDKARCIFELLMSEPLKKHTGTEIAAHCDIAKGASGVAGTLAWPGRFAYRAGRELPFLWQGDTEDEVGGYWMDPVRADLFRSARDASA